MEPFEDTLETALFERLDAALAELAESSKDVRMAMRDQKEISEKVRQSTALDGDGKELIDSYFAAMQLLQGQYNKHLYIQGAKDCVRLLRELGVIR